MNSTLKGKRAVVTGGGRGLGREIALALANEGAKVVVNDPGVARDGSPTTETPADQVVAAVKKAGGEAVASYDSVAEFESASRIIKTCVDSFGGIDILVNTAGILRERMSFNMTPDDWDAVIKTHLYGTFNTCRHSVNYMREQKWGRIVNVASPAWRGTVGQCNYGAAKGGIVSLSRSLARELGRYSVTCNIIEPIAGTRMTLTPEVAEGFKKRLAAGVITKEQYDESTNLPGPQFVAPIVVYLASEHARNINGTVFGTSGGKISRYAEPAETRSVHKDHEKLGSWTLDELIRLVPKTLLVGYVNPAPASGQEK